MSRKIINSRAREIIIKVDNYFAKEKEDTKALLQNVSRSLKNSELNGSDTSQDVVIPKQIVMEMLKHLQNTTKVTERVLSATGIAKNTVAKLRREKEVAAATESRIKTPIKKKRGKKKFLDEFALSVLRNIINSMYTVRKEIPTMRKIMAAAKHQLNYKGSETTLRQIMKNKLGYRFNKCYPKKIVVIERPNIQASRARYLRRMKENDLLGAEKKTVIYIYVSWIDTHYTVKKCLQSGTGVEVRKNDSSGYRWIIVHAGSETGFVNGTHLMFKVKTGDSHNPINSKNFSKWLEQKLIPNIPQNCIIVMDNASYHSEEEDRPPDMGSRKEVMVEWLRARNIEFLEHSTKPELYLLIKNFKTPKIYIIDKLLAEHGHEVVRLPPYNCDLNPVEYVWNIVKQRVAEKNIEQLESKIESLTLEALQSITPADWKREVKHVKTLEEEYWSKDRLIDELFIINTGNDSDSEITDSESNSESDLEDLDCMSGVEEIE